MLDEEEDIVRDAQEIVKRAVVLYAVICIAHGVDKENVMNWLKNNSLWDDLTPSELTYLTSRFPSKQHQINLTWQIEALLVLVWGLGLIEEIPAHDELCDVNQFAKILPPYSGIPVSQFIEKATARSEDELLELEDKLYTAHWEARDAEVNGKPVPADLDTGIIQERHHAINWILGHNDQAWDDVTTDT